MTVCILRSVIPKLMIQTVVCITTIESQNVSFPVRFSLLPDEGSGGSRIARSLLMFNVTLTADCKIWCIYIRSFSECVVELLYKFRAEKYEKRL